MPQIDYDADDVLWLDTLIVSYECVRPLDPNAAEDPEAADEMLRECRRLAERLRAGLLEREPDVVLTQAEIDDIPW